MEEIRRRPFKVCNSDRTRTIGMVLQSLEELKDRAGNKFGLTPTNCRVFLEKDGTEIDNEEYFRILDDQTKLMVVNDGEEWMAESQSKLLKTNLINLVANHCFIPSNFVSTDLHSLKLLLKRSCVTKFSQIRELQNAREIKRNIRITAKNFKGR